MDIIEQFYRAFQLLDYKKMQSYYSSEATFSDPVFGELNAEEVKAMWQMLCQRAENFSFEYKNIICDLEKGSCEWTAVYTFSQTKKKVINKVYSTFVFKDGKIFKQQDTFSLWKWSRQALGFSGLFLGWFPPFQNKIQFIAQAHLKNYMETHGNDDKD
jgi:hypothetical protein